jgi:hypothetical protein
MKLNALLEGEDAKLWVDDLRLPPNNTWDVAKTYQEAIDKLSSKLYYAVSLDHDLGDFSGERERTGYDILMWIVQRKMDGQPVPHSYNVHSANPVAQQRMNGVIQRYLVD